MEYIINWSYKSSLGGPWQAGERVTLTAEQAEAINRDSPGVLSLPSEQQPPDGPPADRMVKGSRRRTRD